MHLNTAKRVLRYVKGIVDYGVFYKKDIDVNFVGYTDSNYVGDIDDRKSTSGYVFMFNSSAISWLSKKQQIVTVSTTGVEFVAATSSASQALWLRNIFKILKAEQKGPTIINCDNMSTIKLLRNPVMHGRSKHINVHFHFFQASMQGKEEGVVIL
ncbi:secreted RxLR effector protein 161-like [Gossypium raimondii]|uniref:secreted RxLR effector protein 161-like n=1 Tax=Gossypium raimondii TaxID=29730 RepID=UPI00227B1F9B|nr:secreted RxLR effector protein 161-like [Gossypium raimondii]